MAEKKKRGKIASFFKKLAFWRKDSSDEESAEETKEPYETTHEETAGKEGGFSKYHEKCFIPLPRDSKMAEEELRLLPPLRQVEYARPTTIHFYTDILEHPIHDTSKKDVKQPRPTKAPVYKIKGNKAVEIKKPIVKLKITKERKETVKEQKTTPKGKLKKKRSLEQTVTQAVPPPSKKAKHAARDDVLTAETPSKKEPETPEEIIQADKTPAPDKKDQLTEEGEIVEVTESASSEDILTTLSDSIAKQRWKKIDLKEVIKLKTEEETILDLRGAERWKEITKAKIIENKGIKKWRRIIESKIIGKCKDGKIISLDEGERQSFPPTSESEAIEDKVEGKKITPKPLTGKQKMGIKPEKQTAVAKSQQLQRKPIKTIPSKLAKTSTPVVTRRQPPARGKKTKTEKVPTSKRIYSVDDFKKRQLVSQRERKTPTRPLIKREEATVHKKEKKLGQQQITDSEQIIEREKEIVDTERERLQATAGEKSVLDETLIKEEEELRHIQKEIAPTQDFPAALETDMYTEFETQNIPHDEKALKYPLEIVESADEKLSEQEFLLAKDETPDIIDMDKIIGTEKWKTIISEKVLGKKGTKKWKRVIESKVFGKPKEREETVSVLHEEDILEEPRTQRIESVDEKLTLVQQEDKMPKVLHEEKVLKGETGADRWRTVIKEKVVGGKRIKKWKKITQSKLLSKHKESKEIPTAISHDEKVEIMPQEFTLANHEEESDDLEIEEIPRQKSLIIPEEELPEDLQKEILSEAIELGIIPKPEYHDLQKTEEYEDLEKEIVSKLESVEEEAIVEEEATAEEEITQDMVKDMETKTKISNLEIEVVDDFEKEAIAEEKEAIAEEKEAIPEEEEAIAEEEIAEGMVTDMETKTKLSSLKIEVVDDLEKEEATAEEEIVEGMVKDMESKTKVSSLEIEAVDDVEIEAIAKEKEAIAEEKEAIPEEEETTAEEEIAEGIIKDMETKTKLSSLKIEIVDDLEKEAIAEEEIVEGMVKDMENKTKVYSLQIEAVDDFEKEAIADEEKTTAEEDIAEEMVKDVENKSKVSTLEIELVDECEKENLLDLGISAILEEDESEEHKLLKFEDEIENQKLLQSEEISKDTEREVIPQEMVSVPEDVENYEDLHTKIAQEEKSFMDTKSKIMSDAESTTLPVKEKTSDLGEKVVSESESKLRETPDYLEEEIAPEPKAVSICEGEMTDNFEEKAVLESQISTIANGRITDYLEEEIAPEFETSILPKGKITDNFNKEVISESETFTKSKEETADSLEEEAVSESEDIMKKEITTDLQKKATLKEEVSEDTEREISQPEASVLREENCLDLEIHVIPETEDLILSEEEMSKNSEKETKSSEDTTLQIEEMTDDLDGKNVPECEALTIDKRPEDPNKKLTLKEEIPESVKRERVSQADFVLQGESYEDLQIEAVPETEDVTIPEELTKSTLSEETYKDTEKGVELDNHLILSHEKIHYEVQKTQPSEVSALQEMENYDPVIRKTPEPIDKTMTEEEISNASEREIMPEAAKDLLLQETEKRSDSLKKEATSEFGVLTASEKNMLNGKEKITTEVVEKEITLQPEISMLQEQENNKKLAADIISEADRDLVLPQEGTSKDAVNSISTSMQENKDTDVVSQHKVEKEKAESLTHFNKKGYWRKIIIDVRIGQNQETTPVIGVESQDISKTTERDKESEMPSDNIAKLNWKTAVKAIGNNKYGKTKVVPSTTAVPEVKEASSSQDQNIEIDRQTAELHKAPLLPEKQISMKAVNAGLANNCVPTLEKEASRNYVNATGRRNSNKLRRIMFWRKVANSIAFFNLARKIRNQRRVAPSPIVKTISIPIEPVLNENLEISSREYIPSARDEQIYSDIDQVNVRTSAVDTNQRLPNSMKDLSTNLVLTQEEHSLCRNHEDIDNEKEVVMSQWFPDSQPSFEHAIQDDTNVATQPFINQRSLNSEAFENYSAAEPQKEECFSSTDQGFIRNATDVPTSLSSKEYLNNLNKDSQVPILLEVPASTSEESKMLAESSHKPQSHSKDFESLNQGLEASLQTEEISSDSNPDDADNTVEVPKSPD